MAAQYQVNIAIQAGTDFSQEYTLANPDKSPLNITGMQFTAALAKHSGALIANESTSTEPVYNVVPFTTRVVDGVNGIYSIHLTASQTKKLQEGKYVYNVILTDVNDIKTDILSGLAFVKVSTASLLP